MTHSIIEKEMGYSKAEFLRQFKTFAQQLEHQLKDNTIIMVDANRRLVISLSEKKGRSIGALLIPSLAVQFKFENYTGEQQTQFLKQFDFSFQRGGG